MFGATDFHTIQEAINAASPSDTIHVRAGAYYGNVVVNETVSLIGENRDVTVINGVVVRVAASNVVIKGFTIRNGSPNIWVEHCSNVSISDNSIKNSGSTGVVVTYSSAISTFYNDIENNVGGYGGVHISDSSNISIHNNNVTENGEGTGIRISGSSSVLIKSNNANSNGFGIYITSSVWGHACRNVSIWTITQTLTSKLGFQSMVDITFLS